MAGTAQLPYNARTLRDNTFYSTWALPVAANTANSAVFDLATAAPYAITEGIVLHISTATATSTANSKNINIRLMDSADNVTFANVCLSSVGGLNTGAPVLRVVDNGGANTLAGTATVALPRHIRRYIKLAALGEANGGDASGSNATARLLF
jgi:hypothetical protein